MNLKLMSISKLFVIAILLIISSCKKNRICGCTVATETINYNSIAECEDGSCIFISMINLVPDSVEKYNVDVYIDNVYKERLTYIQYDHVRRPYGYVDYFPSNEVHTYRVEDDFGKVWQDTFTTYNQFKGEKLIRLSR